MLLPATPPISPASTAIAIATLKETGRLALRRRCDGVGPVSEVPSEAIHHGVAGVAGVAGGVFSELMPQSLLD